MTSLTTTSAPISPLVRTSLIVRDLERSRRFYQDLLASQKRTCPCAI